MAHVEIPVAMLEFHDNGNTIWVHSPVGATVMRIKTMGKIIVDDTCENVVSHVDIIVQGDIHVCLTNDAMKVATPVKRPRPPKNC
jgi:hypothetical protein